MRLAGSYERKMRRSSSPDAPNPVGYSGDKERLMNHTSLREMVDDQDLGTLYAYWTRQRGDRAMPCRADIHPRGIISLLPKIFLVDICQPLRFRFRLVGTAICDRWHADLTGKWLDELEFDGELETVLDQYASVARTGIPRVDKEEFVNESGLYLHYRRLLLPLSEEGESPNMLIGIQKAIGIDGYMVAVPKWV
jgi:hypothetical protein